MVTGVKLSQINSGTSVPYNSATDVVVGVRSGTTDELIDISGAVGVTSLDTLKGAINLQSDSRTINISNDDSHDISIDVAPALGDVTGEINDTTVVGFNGHPLQVADTPSIKNQGWVYDTVTGFYLLKTLQ